MIRAERARSTRQVLATELLAKLDGEIAVGVVVERFGKRADEQGLLVERPCWPSSRSAWTSGWLLNAARWRSASYIAAGPGAGRNRPAEPLERELAIEQLGICGGAREIAVGGLELPGGERGAPGPVIPLVWTWSERPPLA